MREPNEKEIAEMQADVEKARLFRDFAESSIWKKHIEPFLYKLQQDAEAESLTSFRGGGDMMVMHTKGAVASGRAQGAEEFALFIVRGINDAKQSEKRLVEIEEAKKKQGAAK